MTKEYSGYFISMEGPDGSGKTSNIPPLVEHLRSLGVSVFPTREPGGTSIGEKIRDVLHDKKNTEMTDETETLLYLASRAQIVREVLSSQLLSGSLVLADRFGDSTMAYQGYGREQDLKEICSLVKYATGGLTPDLSVLMDVSVETGIRRKKSQQEWNRMDAQDRDFHERVRQGYLELVKEEPQRWIVINAEQDRESVFKELVRVLEDRLSSVGLLDNTRRNNSR